MRWTAVTAQRNAELIIARLNAVPDLRVSAGWRYFQDTNYNAVRSACRYRCRSSTRTPATSSPPRRRWPAAERAINGLVLTSIAGRADDALTGALAELKLHQTSVIPNPRSAAETIQSGYLQGPFTLLALLDAKGSALQALLREQEILQNFHIAVATIEWLVGNPFALTRESSR